MAEITGKAGRLSLDDYRVAADQPSPDGTIVVLTCDICGQRGNRGDVRWYEDGSVPSLANLIADAEQHERQGHRP